MSHQGMVPPASCSCFCCLTAGRGRADPVPLCKSWVHAHINISTPLKGNNLIESRARGVNPCQFFSALSISFHSGYDFNKGGLSLPKPKKKKNDLISKKCHLVPQSRFTAPSIPASSHLDHHRAAAKYLLEPWMRHIKISIWHNTCQ